MSNAGEAKAIVEVALSQRTVKVFQMVIKTLYEELDGHLATIEELRARINELEGGQCSISNQQEAV